MKKILTVVLFCALMLPMLLTACNTTPDEKTSATTPGDGESTTTPSGGESTTTPSGGESTTVPSTGESTTVPSASDDPVEPVESVIQTNWSLGYVGSSTNSSNKNKINTSGSYYSYTDVITIEKAGTTVSFVDDNTNNNQDSGFASAAAYVFSSWKKVGNNWEIDLDAANIPGVGKASSANSELIGDTVRYFYTTTKDNENLRICFRSGQKADFTPAAYPQIKAVTGGAPGTTTPDSTDSTDSGELAIELVWNRGYVGSTDNTAGYQNKINPTGGTYSHTDVFTIAKKGTLVWFTDDNTNDNGDGGFASKAAYVFSSWKQENGSWVIDLDGANFPGVGKANSAYSEIVGNSVKYFYTTSKDNENLRICYRSGQSASFTPPAHPAVYFKFTGKIGSTEAIELEKAQFEEWVNTQRATVAADSPLKGITMLAIGDSYFAGHNLSSTYVWPSLLSLKYEMNFTNYGINGSAVSAFASNNNPMVNRYTSMADNNPKIVLVEGGKNDYNQSVPLGAVGTPNTFRGDLATMLNGIKQKYPNALIICYTPWNVAANANSAGHTVLDYTNAMREVCDSLGIICFNASDPSLSGVDMTDAAFRAVYCLAPTDISHLNLDGHKLILPKFEAFIAEKYAEFIAK